MGGRNETLSSGLGLMYKGNLVIIISTVFIIIPVLNVLALIAMAAGGIMNVIGLANIRREHPDYVNAEIALIVGLVTDVLRGGAIGTIASLFMIYFVIRGTNQLLGEIGRPDVAQTGDRAWKYEIACTIIRVASAIFILLLPVIGVAIKVFGVVVSVIGTLIYMDYLQKSSRAFA